MITSESLVVIVNLTAPQLQCPCANTLSQRILPAIEPSSLRRLLVYFESTS